MDEFLRQIHAKIEEYMRRHVSDDHDWEQVDDEDCWGVGASCKWVYHSFDKLTGRSLYK